MIPVSLPVPPAADPIGEVKLPLNFMCFSSAPSTNAVPAARAGGQASHAGGVVVCNVNQLPSRSASCPG